jgi:glycosyltransferase involved in cell wall biosynthesis
MGCTIHIWSLAAESPGISGGDKIFLECARHWSSFGHQVTIYTNESGVEMVRVHDLKNIKVVLIPSLRFRKFGFAVHYLIRVLQACFYSARLKLSEKENPHLFYSASDFWPDSLPALILRLRYPQHKWLAGFYFYAPSPFQEKQDLEYRGGKQPVSIRSFFYFVMQRMIYPFIKRNANGWIVANELDRQILEKEGISRDHTYAIYGGVDVRASSSARANSQVSYEGCFVGRFHVQKGVQFLIPIWTEVLKILPDAKLAIIGEGPLRKELEEQILKNNLSQNIFVLGYVDGEKKYSILKASRVFLHTPLWDTGGMAAAEAMACGLPVIAFDIPGYQYSYPRGMLKAKREDANHFASLIVKLLQDPVLYKKIQDEALEFVQEWDWNHRVKTIETKFSDLFGKTST